MPDQPQKFYLTTPIYYVNARPHIGHAYSTIAADVLARRHRLLGDDVFFLTGTDEHGQKVQRSAAAAEIAPQQFADQVSATFRALWDRMGITYSDFIRTTEPRHKAGVQKLWRELESRGQIYVDAYTGAYCVSDEAFVDVPPGAPCPECGRPTEQITEENYFFKLSEYQQRLLDLIESNSLHIQPESVRNEVLSFLRGGLKDLSISRTTFDWGIAVPGNPKHVVYVWLDALTNYITAIGYGSHDPAEQEKFARYWPADIHLVGKEITRFHCVYWPAFLMAAGLPLPRSVVANGWLLFEESKMSKSRGNVVRTETILDAFGDHYRASLVKAAQPEPDRRDCDLWAADVLRYFLLREIPFGHDGSFSFDALITRYNADLANGYGNLVSRVLKLVDGLGGVPAEACADNAGSIRTAAETAIEAVRTGYAEQRFSSVTAEIASLIAAVDGMLTAIAPWKLLKSADAEDRRRAQESLFTAAEALRILAVLLYPVMPHTTAKVWAQLGLGDIEQASQRGELKDLTWGGLRPGTKLGALAPIFPRAPKELADTMAEIESRNSAAKLAPESSGPSPAANASSDVRSAAAAPTPAAPINSAAPANGVEPEAPAQITIDDFARIELRVARIEIAERIPKADKLLRLEVDLGFEKRQILSGIAQWYAPEELIGRRIAVIANLPPRKMRGLESHGMLLAASDEADPNGKPILASFSDETPLGSRIR